MSLNNSGGKLVTLSDSNAVVIEGYAYSSADDNQSITRDPEIIGPDPMVNHSDATGADGALFSPGTEIDGDPLKKQSRFIESGTALT